MVHNDLLPRLQATQHDAYGARLAANTPTVLGMQNVPTMPTLPRRLGV